MTIKSKNTEMQERSSLRVASMVRLLLNNCVLYIVALQLVRTLKKQFDNKHKSYENVHVTDSVNPLKRNYCKEFKV